MDKLEQLKNLVGSWFDACEDKQTLDQLSAIKKACDDVEAEQNKLQAENKELLKDYKELVTHTSFNDQHNQPKNTLGGEAVSFEDALAEFMKKN